MKIGILTSGGDCPGLNAVIRGFAKYVYNNIPKAEIIGISEAFQADDSTGSERREQA